MNFRIIIVYNSEVLPSSYHKIIIIISNKILDFVIVITWSAKHIANKDIDIIVILVMIKFMILS